MRWLRDHGHEATAMTDVLSARSSASKRLGGEEGGALEMRVLLAADESEAARIAESWILRLGWAVQPRVDILCVAQPRRLAAGIALQTYRDAVRNAVADLRQADLLQAMRIANSVGERLQSARLVTRAWARVGSASSEISAMVRTEAPDLLVIGGGCRRGWFSRRDTASEVLRQVDVATLVVRTAPEGEHRLPRRVAALTSGGGGSQFHEWLGQAGLLDVTEVMVRGLEDLREMDPDARPDLAVVGRQGQSRIPDLMIRKSLESVSAVLVLPPAASAQPAPMLGAC
jgi:hypothetical protein